MDKTVWHIHRVLIPPTRDQTRGLTNNYSMALTNWWHSEIQDNVESASAIKGINAYIHKDRADLKYMIAVKKLHSKRSTHLEFRSQYI